jgi:hypothetical protein
MFRTDPDPDPADQNQMRIRIRNTGYDADPFLWESNAWGENRDFFVYFFGDSFAYVAHFVFLRDVRIRTQRAAVARRRATNF